MSAVDVSSEPTSTHTNTFISSERENELLRELEKLRQTNRLMSVKINRLERKSNKMSAELKSMQAENNPTNLCRKHFTGIVFIHATGIPSFLHNINLFFM